MRKLIATAMVIAVMSMTTVSHASQHEVTVTMSANVSNVLTLSTQLFRGTVSTANAIAGTAANFGALTGTVDGGLFGQDFYSVQLLGNAQSRRYVINFVGTQMSNGAVTLPNATCRLNMNAGGDALPQNAVLGDGSTTSFSFVQASKKQVYDSGPAGKTFDVYAVLSLASVQAANDPNNAGATENIPFDQASGTYTGSVTFNIELKS